MDFAYVAPAGAGTAALLGLAAGLAVALPLGAIGLLLVREGLTHGPRIGAAGALAIGVVDLLYATAPRAFARFFGLTAVNPLTALTFAAVAVALGPRMASTGERAAFVAGVFVASLAWQLVLVGIGAFLVARLPARAQTWLQFAGFGLVLAAVLARG